MEALKNNSQAIVRALTVAVAVVLQAITMVLVGRYLHEYASWAYVLLEIISFLLVFGLINDQESYRQFWCVIVLVFPVTGLFLYYMWGQRRRNSKTHILIRETEAKMRQYVPHQPEVMEELQELHPYKVQIARFLGSEGFNMYRHTDVKYFPLGEEMLDAMIEDLKKDYTIVIVTHNMQQATRISDRCAFFLHGELVEAGETEHLFSVPKDKRTEDYITGRFG